MYQLLVDSAKEALLMGNILLKKYKMVKCVNNIRLS